MPKKSTRAKSSKTDNIIRKRRAVLSDLVKRAIESCAAMLDGMGYQGEPMFEADIEFTFPDGNRIKSRPAHDLKNAVPEPRSA